MVGVAIQTSLASPLGSELVGVIGLTPCSAYAPRIVIYRDTLIKICIMIEKNWWRYILFLYNILCYTEVAVKKSKYIPKQHMLHHTCIVSQSYRETCIEIHIQGWGQVLFEVLESSTSTFHNGKYKYNYSKYLEDIKYIKYFFIQVQVKYKYFGNKQQHFPLPSMDYAINYRISYYFELF